jgi:FdhD protein
VIVMTSSRTHADVTTVDDGRRAAARDDVLATEEPMETRLIAAGRRHTVAVTMRTPGSDFELSAGFLYGEGIVATRDQIRAITYCRDREVEPEQRYNIVNVELRSGLDPDLRTLERHFYTNSSCGVCGKASLEALEIRGCPIVAPGPLVTPEVIYALPDQLRRAQRLFEDTGGLHAAALFDAAGNLETVREDVGRHNAIDKLVGWALLQGRLPLANHIVMVSGRSSFEILQKCVAAGAPILCAVSAPSSLAIDVARRFGVTLVGFLRGRRFNIYSGKERIAI